MNLGCTERNSRALGNGHLPVLTHCTGIIIWTCSARHIVTVQTHEPRCSVFNGCNSIEYHVHNLIPPFTTCTRKVERPRPVPWKRNDRQENSTGNEVSANSHRSMRHPNTPGEQRQPEHALAGWLSWKERIAPVTISLRTHPPPFLSLLLLAISKGERCTSSVYSPRNIVNHRPHPMQAPLSLLSQVSPITRLLRPSSFIAARKRSTKSSRCSLTPHP